MGGKAPAAVREGAPFLHVEAAYNMLQQANSAVAQIGVKGMGKPCGTGPTDPAVSRPIHLGDAAPPTRHADRLASN